MAEPSSKATSEVMAKESRPSEPLDIDQGQIVETDIAAQILAGAGDHEPITEAEFNALRKKLDWTLLPMLCVCMQLSGWDKVV
jgi:hypothetical protein